jgi:hypothetical protein
MLPTMPDSTLVRRVDFPSVACVTLVKTPTNCVSSNMTMRTRR